MPRLRLLVPALLASVLIGLTGCSFEPEGEGEGGTETDTGAEPGTVTLVVDADPDAICAEFGGSITFMARRVDCWDPQLPCTVPQVPPWIEGTVADCSTVVPGVTRWEVEITQTGRWEARIQAGELACFGLAGEARTNVSNDDLDAAAVLTLSPAPAGVCGEP